MLSTLSLTALQILPFRVCGAHYLGTNIPIQTSRTGAMFRTRERRPAAMHLLRRPVSDWLKSCLAVSHTGYCIRVQTTTAECNFEV